MSNFEDLRKRTSNGSIRLIHVEAVPRSISTALSRALNESDTLSVYVNEPLNGMKHDIQAAAGYILEAADSISRSNDLQVVVITKNLSRNLTLPLFQEWMGICDGIVWSVRDPLVQMGSLITRVANDLTFEPGVDRLEQHEVTPVHIEAVAAYLMKAAPISFSKTSWTDMGEHFRSAYYPKRSIVIDGGRLTSHPEEVLRHASDVLNLPYSRHMVTGWRHGYVNKNPGHNPKLSDAERAWTKHAVTSNGIVRVDRLPFDLSLLPDSLRLHITNVAMPIYKEMVGHSTQEDLQAIR